MSIGSFLADAGYIGAEAEDFANKREVQRAQRAEAQARQLELARREQSRQQAGLKTMADYVGAAPTYDNLPDPMDVAGVTPPSTPTPTTAAPPTGGAPGGVKPPVTTAPRTAAKPPVLPAKAGLESGRGGFRAYAPGESDFNRAGTRMANTKRLDDTLLALSQQTDVFAAGIRKPFATQTDKADITAREAASDWYVSAAAKKYFRDYPQALEIAQTNPVGFYQSLQQKNRERDAAAKTKAAAPKAAATAAPKAAASRTDTEIALDTNPGALKDGDYARSQPGYTGRSGKFATFATPEQGIAAQENLLRINYLGQGITTVESIIDKYTPAGKENPEANRNNYKNYVAGKLGVSRNTQIGEGQLSVLAQAMREFETGRRGPSAGAGTGAGVGEAAGAQQPPRSMKPSEFYLNREGPALVAQGTSDALQARNRMVQIADRYRQEGRLDEFDAMLLQIDAQDRNIRMLQGMQGIFELEYARNPSRLAAVWSDYAGVPIQIQPRTDGTYNIMTGGQVIASGVDSSTLRDQARQTFDQAYLQQRAESQNAMMLKRFELQFGMDKDMAIEAMKSVSAANVALINGKAEVAKQQVANLRRIMLASPGGGAWVAEGNNISKLVDEYRPPGAPESVPAGPAMIRVDVGAG